MSKFAMGELLSVISKFKILFVGDFEIQILASLEVYLILSIVTFP